MNFADFLRAWRARRHLSQLQLGLEAEVSARHISFLESGRASPSKAMVARLAHCLQIPMDETNQAYLAAGFAPVFRQHDPGNRDIARINQAVAGMLDGHMPLPALVLDRHWNITAANPAATRLMADAGLAGHGNLIEATISDAAVAVIENWPEAALALFRRLRQEHLESGGNRVLGDLAQRLRRALHRHLGDTLPEIDHGQAVLPTRFALAGHTLSVFSAIARFGTVFDTRLGDIRVELMFPLDDETRAYFDT